MGSSPLTRGKLLPLVGDALALGLIPAHAGKTRARPGPWRRCGAHPRSRGENSESPFNEMHLEGSSPLTRGKPRSCERSGQAWGLIPAHAGKTELRSPIKVMRRAHPRSRGENRFHLHSSASRSGSSPLTRGKPAKLQKAHRAQGLIPAHAGKTRGPGCGMRAGQAHPRSRGENLSAQFELCSMVGSSPLTRGKLCLRRCDCKICGLIPAHAGKTWRTRGLRPRRWAHPRSRGENQAGRVLLVNAKGSSPLTRGKLVPTQEQLDFLGLIPAHAGKTSARRRSRHRARAHPRSRGENMRAGEMLSASRGSSPLTRGKPVRASRCLARLGLIPAHAGKTGPRSSAIHPGWAHPRSRGENGKADYDALKRWGSSPLTRGKPRVVVVLGNVKGLIPAHAGKTPGPATSSACKRAHPRSRGENPVGGAFPDRSEGSSPLTRGKP